MKSVLSLIFIVLLWTNSFSYTVVSHSAEWDDSARVLIIWNNAAISFLDLAVQPGIETRTFVKEALALLDSAHIRIHDLDWPGLSWTPAATWDTVNNLWGAGKPPHVIVLIDAGWPLGSGKASVVDVLLKTAANAGIGIVCIGDDAIGVAQNIFNFQNVVNMPKPMDDATFLNRPEDKLWILLDRKEDHWLPDGGLLWQVGGGDSLLFKERSRTGRGQADSDAWDVDTNSLDNYSFVGYQQGYDNDGDTSSTSNRPKYLGFDLKCRAMSALQKNKNRAVILSYQPSYLLDGDKSAQVVYNATFWASKAHAPQQIPTPEIYPLCDTIYTGDTISIRVPMQNTSLYTLRYSMDGSVVTLASDKYTVGFLPPQNAKTLTVRARAFATDTVAWLHSKEAIRTFIILSSPKIIITANPPSGAFFDASLHVTLTTNYPDAKIIYTVDGSDPLQTGIPYAAPILLTYGPVTIKAFAWLPQVDTGYGEWTYFQNPPSVDSASYRDEDANGIVELVRIHLKKKVALSLIEKIVVTWTAGGESAVATGASAISYSGVDSSVIQVDLSKIFQTTVLRKYMTCGAMSAVLSYRGFAKAHSFAVADQAAPVLKDRVVFACGSIYNGTQRYPDTLIARFSEDVKQPSTTEPFFFLRPPQTRYGMTLLAHECTGDRAVFIVQVIAGVLFPYRNDSVWINTAAALADGYGNVQSNPSNIMAPLDIKEQPYSIVIEAVSPVSPNKPFPQNLLSPSRIGKAVSFTSGLYIRVDPQTLPLGNKPLFSSASVCILDAVGNCVASTDAIDNTSSNLAIRRDISDERLHLFWSCRNNNNRVVGNGVYAVIIGVTDKYGVKTLKKLSVGVNDQP